MKGLFTTLLTLGLAVVAAGSVISGCTGPDIPVTGKEIQHATGLILMGIVVLIFAVQDGEYKP